MATAWTDDAPRASLVAQSKGKDDTTRVKGVPTTPASAVADLKAHAELFIAASALAAKGINYSQGSVATVEDSAGTANPISDDNRDHTATGFTVELVLVNGSTGETKTAYDFFPAPKQTEYLTANTMKTDGAVAAFYTGMNSTNKIAFSVDSAGDPWYVQSVVGGRLDSKKSASRTVKIPKLNQG